VSTVVYKNAVVLVDGAAIRASLNELGIELSAEMLDATTFGQDTRIHRGGLQEATISGGGLAESGDGMVETALFTEVGEDDSVVSVYPNGIVEGSQDEGSGYAMKGVASEFQLGGPVGALLPLRFTIAGRGIEA
jgi:hypothetical protein